jgi:hypothetical protein
LLFTSWIGNGQSDRFDLLGRSGLLWRLFVVTNHFSVEPTEGDKPAWSILKDSQIIAVYPEKEQAEWIAFALNEYSFLRSILGLHKSRKPANDSGKEIDT